MRSRKLFYTHTPGNSELQSAFGNQCCICTDVCLKSHKEKKYNLYVINTKFKALHTTTQDPDIIWLRSLEGLKVNLASVSKVIYSLNM